MAGENYINHIALVLDASSSMTSNARELIKVADNQIQYLAQRSKELDQETRVSVYSFADKVQCLIYDKDVLRLPSIKELYKPYGWTALLDATIQTQDDLDLTPEKYGDHAFLTFILTDGAENASKSATVASVSSRLKNLKDNRTVAVLVPDQHGAFEAKRVGFPADNIAVWRPDEARGVAEAGDTIRRATEAFMTARTSGVRSSKSLFSMGSDALNKRTVTSSLTPLKTGEYMLINVLPRYDRWEVKPFVADHGLPFKLGQAFYQLSKREEIQPHKQIAVYEKKTGKVYSGPQARQVVGLPDSKIRVSPEDNPDYDLFVQSTAPNRKVDANTKLLYMK